MCDLGRFSQIQSQLTQLTFTAFVDYQMMVAQWYSVILARNGSIRVIVQTKLLESTSGTVPNAMLSHHSYLLTV